MFKSLMASFDALLQTLLTAASDAIEKYCRRDFVSTAYDELYSGNGDRKRMLRQYPIVSVQSVRYRPVTVIKITNTDPINVQARVTVTSTGLTLVRVKDGVKTPVSRRRLWRRDQLLPGQPAHHAARHRRQRHRQCPHRLGRLPVLAGERSQPDVWRHAGVAPRLQRRRLQRFHARRQRRQQRHLVADCSEYRRLQLFAAQSSVLRHVRPELRGLR
jgi:hypothetical protein